MRRLYEQGKTVNGAGINASFAVHQVCTTFCRLIDISVLFPVLVSEKATMFISSCVLHTCLHWA